MLNPSDRGWILVTGASAGIGKALVKRLVGDGANVVAAVRGPARAPVLNGPGHMETLQLDFEQRQSVERLSAEIAAIVGAGRLGGVVNMAGIIVEGPIEAVPVDQVRRQFEVNVIGPMSLVQPCMPLLTRSRGTIVNIGAVSAHLTPPYYGPIAASKATLASLTDAMRQEFAPYGVRVVLIEPSAMRTGIFATSQAARDAWLRESPDVERRHRPALSAMEAAFAKAGADDPGVVVDAVLTALSNERARPRRIVGKGARAFVLLGCLPIRLRDRMVRSALGLKDSLRPAI